MRSGLSLTWYSSRAIAETGSIGTDTWLGFGRWQAPCFLGFEVSSELFPSFTRRSFPSGIHGGRREPREPRPCSLGPRDVCRELLAGVVRERPAGSGLHHRYERRAAYRARTCALLHLNFAENSALWGRDRTPRACVKQHRPRRCADVFRMRAYHRFSLPDCRRCGMGSESCPARLGFQAEPRLYLRVEQGEARIDTPNARFQETMR